MTSTIERNMQNFAAIREAQCERELLGLEGEVVAKAKAYREAYIPWLHAQDQWCDHIARDHIAQIEELTRSPEQTEALGVALECAREKLQGSDEALRAAVGEVMNVAEHQEAWRVVMDNCAGFDMLSSFGRETARDDSAPGVGGRRWRWEWASNDAAAVRGAICPLAFHPSTLVRGLAEETFWHVLEELRETPDDGDWEVIAEPVPEPRGEVLEGSSGEVLHMLRLAWEKYGHRLVTDDEDFMLEERQLLAIELSQV
ncbi:hypothetical protein RB595_003067 [Gaeumannomyces hyphopodioides]